MSDKITDEMRRAAAAGIFSTGRFWYMGDRGEPFPFEELAPDVQADYLKMADPALAAVYPLIEKQVREECARVIKIAAAEAHAKMQNQSAYELQRVSDLIRALGEKP